MLNNEYKKYLIIEEKANIEKNVSGVRNGPQI